MHAVEAESPPPCERVPTPTGRRVVVDTADDSCLLLGPAALDARDIASARTEAGPIPGQTSLELRLTTEGGAKLDRLAAAYFGRRIAVLVQGDLVSAPTVHATEYKGRVEVSGLTHDEAFRVAEEIERADS